MKKVTGFILRDGMSLEEGERVEVYYNLQQGGFSIKSLDKRNPNNGKVVAYAEHVLIEDATFHISLNKLEQIRANNCKTVYAVVRGTFRSTGEFDNAGHRRGYCNPFRTGEFIDFDSGVKLEQAAQVYFYEKFLSYQA